MTTQEAGIPDAVVYAAAKAMLQLRHSGQPGVGYMELARAALETAAPAAIRQPIAEVEAWRERAETAENAVERARDVCYKAMAEKDAPGQWLVAQKVLAAIEEPSNLPPETPAKEET